MKASLMMYLFVTGWMLGIVLRDVSYTLEFKLWFFVWCHAVTFWLALLLNRLDEIEEKKEEGPILLLVKNGESPQ